MDKGVTKAVADVSAKGTGTLLSLPPEALKYFCADSPDCCRAIAKLSALISELKVPA